MRWRELTEDAPRFAGIVCQESLRRATSATGVGEPEPLDDLFRTE